MAPQSHLPLYQGMLRRPRVQSLIQQGLEYPLLILLAAPGYGKTQAMAEYLSQSNARTLWLRLGSLDNLYTHFWAHLRQGLERDFPALAKRLRTLEFPDTPSKFIVFHNVLSKEISGEGPVIWVLDDFGEINSPGMKTFFRMLTELEPENFRLVLVSNVPSSIQFLPLMSGRRFVITGENLRFTAEEIAELYRMHGVSLGPEELHRIEGYTEGWPLPLHILALNPAAIPGSQNDDGVLTHRRISSMFEERFFSAYSRPQQKLFAGLSLLHSFTRELMADLYEGDPADLEAAAGHAFIINEPATGRFFFHYLYCLFLQGKTHLLSSGEQTQVWRQAAEYYAAAGDAIPAIACFRKCGDHQGMLTAMCDCARTQHGITMGNADFFLEHLDLLTPEEQRNFPVADYLRALVHLNTLELEKTESLLLGLEQRLLAQDTPEALSLLGDVYASLGSLHMMETREDFGDYYKKASGYLPAGTNFKNKNKLLNLNNHNFSMADNQPGARERMEQAVHYGVPWASRVLAGGLSGMEYIFSAEASYLSYELDAAQQHAYRGIYKAEASAQHDLVCNGFCILARTAYIRGDSEKLQDHIQSITDYAERYELNALKEIRDTALAWYYIKLRDFKKIPKAILTINESEHPMLAYGRTQIVYANFLIAREEYAKLVGMLEYPKGLFLTQGIWQDRIALFIMRAIGYCQMEKPGAAMEALWTAYDMAYRNNLTTLFIEAEHFMLPLISLAREQREYAFDRQWLDHIDEQAGAFARRAAAVRASYRKQSTVKTGRPNPLTRREEEILRDLSRGLTREEIAVVYSISVNTVKSFIRTIYNKLDASNRAEAVSIAILNGYIDTPEFNEQ
ncbi:helix-turn-helix transcriptional regulator [Breznakiella homolactica]|uniref:HTH luxR-type domain-containing protein n=1 Tax=Breznakiella homolactica TaxID=2798577 RepID=A0A7T8BB14_9SPIR|nr:LuxR C-terminal-related transcriptional regulator [Breznakiella homolactica]QQO08748.1 LuxR C-terminal-related transcriptional regulator [Breznakiella homolactica]